MRILYVTNESPIFPSGGIGTYIGYMASAMERAGHEIFLLTWTYQPRSEAYNYWPFKSENTRICYLEGIQVHRQFPQGPYNYAVSAILSDEILSCANEWQIEVIESADFLAPSLRAFQHIQSSSLSRNILCSTFNHGFIEDYNDADQIASSVYTQNELTSERQQLRISDLILTPSVAARSRLHRYGITENIVVTREPYAFQTCTPCDSAHSSIQFLGRLCLSKGVDKLILLANLMNSSTELDEVLFIGKEDRIPFRANPREYILERLTPTLRDKVKFLGELSRDEALACLRAGSFFPVLGAAETFSFACLEAIDRGVLPIVMSGTPMESFFPPDLRHYILDKKEPDVRQWQRTVNSIAQNASEIVKRLQQYNQEELDPSRIAQSVGVLYDAARKKKKKYALKFARRRAVAHEVSFLVSVTEAGNMQAVIDAICAQTVKAQNVLICFDQGSISETVQGYIRLRLPHCTLLEQPLVGRAALFKMLLQKTKTKLCVFLDEHTILAPNFLVEMLRAYNTSVIIPQAVSPNQYRYGVKPGKVLSQFMGDHVHFLRNDMVLTALIETEVASEIGFDVTRRNDEDLGWAFWLDFDSRGYKHIWVPRFLINTFQDNVPEEGAVIGSHVMVRDVLLNCGKNKAGQDQLIVQALFARQRIE